MASAFQAGETASTKGLWQEFLWGILDAEGKPVKPEQCGQEDSVQGEVRHPSDGHLSYKYVPCITFQIVYSYTHHLPFPGHILCHPRGAGLRISAVISPQRLLRALLHQAGQGRTC